MSAPGVMDRARTWFAQRDWQPYAFQTEVWEAAHAGRSGLLSVPTGSGKTYAALIGLLERVADRPADGLRIIYVSPLRAVARDIARAIEVAIEGMGLDLTVGSRTGDTKSSERSRQGRQLPHVLVTTPESLALLLARADTPRRFAAVEGLILDEWHELLQSKRGTMTELCAARVRTLSPDVVTWALSATIGNLEEAACVAVGAHAEPLVIRPAFERPLALDVLIPKEIDDFPWAGHLGLTMVEPLLERIEDKGTTLVFTNTRAQAELWYQAFVEARPAEADRIGIHHGSIGSGERESVEEGLRSGQHRIAVATSSLDLGVDFSPVDHVVQIGSPKGIARLLQRAGRSAHRPGATCTITLVPTHSLELVEFAAARRAIERGEIEPRHAPHAPLDVLAQHLVTRALGGGFTEEEILEEVRGAWSYRELSPDALAWAIDLVERGGATLRAYEQHHRIVCDEGTFRIASERIARLHRMNVGTITSDTGVEVRFRNGRRLGTVEETFATRLRPGDAFHFAGKQLSVIRLRDTILTVEPGRSGQATTPRWMGGRMPLSTSLSAAVRRTLTLDPDAEDAPAEFRAVAPVLAAQRRLSALPADDTGLCEVWHAREGSHLFVYPFEGRLVHEGLGALLAYRMTRDRPATLVWSVNDYGLQLTCPDFFPFEEVFRSELFEPERMAEDVMGSIDASEMDRRQFREVARVAGLVVTQQPGARRSDRQLHASASLLYEVFRRHDPDNLLLHQARREVLENQFEQERLHATLVRCRAASWPVHVLRRPSPLAFPLIVDTIRERVSSESLVDRIARLKNRCLKAESQSPSRTRD